MVFVGPPPPPPPPPPPGAGGGRPPGRWWWETPETKECGLHLVDGRLQRIAKQGVEA